MKPTDANDGVVYHAGFPNAGEDGLSALSLDKLVFKHPVSTFLWRLTEPVEQFSWPAGAIVVVDRSLTPKFGDKVVAVIDEAFVVRTFKSNHLYEPDGSEDKTDNVLVWGVVTNILVSYR